MIDRISRLYAAVCIGILALFMGAIFYCFPQVDDYSYAVRTLKIGWLNSQIQEYLTWNGRFFATGLITASPLVWGNLYWYRLLPIVLLFGYVISLFFLLSQWPRFIGTQKNKIFWTISIATLFFLAQPSVAQGFFWMSSSYTYVVSLIFVNLSAGLLVKKTRSHFEVTMAAIFSAILVGCNETTMLMWLYVVGAFFIFKLYFEKEFDKGLLLVLCVSVLAGVIVFLAPGNALRASAFEGNHRVFFTLGNGISYSFIFPIRFLTLGIISFCLFFSERLAADWKTEDLKRFRYTLLLFWMGIIFVSFLPSLWAMGRKPNERSLNVVLHFYLIGLFIIVPLFVNLNKISNSLQSSLLKKRLAAVMLFLCLIANRPMLNLVRGYTGDFQAYEKNWLKMINGEETNLLPPEKRSPILYAKDIEEHEKIFKTFIELRPGFFKNIDGE